MSPRLLPVLLVSASLACTPPSVPPPAADPDVTIPNALAPNLTAPVNGNVLLTALKVTSTGHQFVVLNVDVADQDPVVIAEGNDFFANWADVPGLVEAGDGSLIAHWLQKSGVEVYDYGIRLARSTDGGETWADLGWLNDDGWAPEGGAPGEHGFVAWVPEGDGARAFWLDGRAAGGHDAEHAGGAMQLRTTTVVDGEVAPSEVLDDRICDCCPTAAVMTSSGPLVAFRDRTADEIRDVQLLRRTEAGWQRTAIDTSGWQIAGCPVNGPALAVDDNLVLVAWYTAHPGPRVYAAWSEDGGDSFGDPTILTTDTLGRVSTAILDDRGYVTWLRRVEEAAEEGAVEEIPAGEVRMVRLAPGGTPEGEVVVAETSATRRAGIPRLVADDDGLILAWTVVVPGSEGETSTQIAVRRFTPK